MHSRKRQILFDVLGQKRAAARSPMPAAARPRKSGAVKRAAHGVAASREAVARHAWLLALGGIVVLAVGPMGEMH